MEREQFKEPDGKPTIRQIYALAAALCERANERFPATRIEASELIERLRTRGSRAVQGKEA
jgi:hypothetical protein